MTNSISGERSVVIVHVNLKSPLEERNGMGACMAFRQLHKHLNINFLLVYVLIHQMKIILDLSILIYISSSKFIKVRQILCCIFLNF